jgi:hypothetical protein
VFGYQWEHVHQLLTPHLAREKKKCHGWKQSKSEQQEWKQYKKEMAENEKAEAEDKDPQYQPLLCEKIDDINTERAPTIGHLIPPGEFEIIQQ